jgi:WD40 repeat protein
MPIMKNRLKQPDDTHLKSQVNPEEEPSVFIVKKTLPTKINNRREFIAKTVLTGTVFALGSSIYSSCKKDNKEDKVRSDYISVHQMVHSDWINAIAMSPIGDVLVSASDDKTIKIWSLPDGNLIRILEGHTGSVQCVAISPDGELLASGCGSDLTVKIWNLSSGTLLTTIIDTQSTDKSIGALVFSSDRNTIAYASMNKIKLCSVTDGLLLKTLSGHTSGIKTMAISPDGKYLVSGSYDCSFKIWNLPDGSLRVTNTETSCTCNAVAGWIETNNFSIESIVFSADGSYFAAYGVYTVGTSRFVSIKLWNNPSGILKKTIIVDGVGSNGYGINSVSYNQNTNTLITPWFDDKKIRLWSLPDGVLSGIIEGTIVWSVAVSPDGKTLASSGGRIIQLWSLPSGTNITPPCTCDQVCSCDTVAFSNGSDVCTCNSVEICTCNKVCSCNTVCTSNQTCSCNYYVSSYSYWYPN